MFDSIRAAPGVSPTSPSSGTVNTVSRRSAPAPTRTCFSSTAPTSPVRAPACPGRAQRRRHSGSSGAVRGCVRRIRQHPGHGVQRHHQTGQQSLPVRRVVLRTDLGPDRAAGRAAGCRPPTLSGYERARYRDFTTNLGGPVRRDRLWFFGGYQHLRDYDSQPGADPQFPRTYEQDKIFAKLTWQLKPGLQLMQSFHQEFWVNPQLPTVVTPFAATARSHASVPTMTFGHLTQTLSPNTVWDVRVGRFVYLRHDDPSSAAIPRLRTGSTARRSVSSGNPPQIGRADAHSHDRQSDPQPLPARVVRRRSRVKIGAQFERGRAPRNPQSFRPASGSSTTTGCRFRRSPAPPSISGGEFITAAAFASDALTLGGPLDDQRRSAVRPQPRHQPGPATRSIRKGARRARSSDGLGTLYTWNVVSPRLGVTAKLTADGRTILRASYGRFNQGVLTGEICPIHPGVTPVTTTQFDPATGGYTQLVSVVDPKINLHARSRHADAPHRRVLDRRRSRAGLPTGRGSSPTSARPATTSSPGPTSAASTARNRGRCPTAARCRSSC